MHVPHTLRHRIHFSPERRHFLIKFLPVLLRFLPVLCHFLFHILLNLRRRIAITALTVQHTAVRRQLRIVVDAFSSEDGRRTVVIEQSGVLVVQAGDAGHQDARIQSVRLGDGALVGVLRAGQMTAGQYAYIEWPFSLTKPD